MLPTSFMQLSSRWFANLGTRLAPPHLNTPHQYLFVFFLMVFALLMRLVIAPLDGGVQYVTFFPAVAIAAVIGGLWPGLFAGVLGLIMATYLFWPPYMMLDFSFSRNMVVSNLVFFTDAIIVCSSIEAMHRFYRKFVDAEKELRLAASVFEKSTEGVLVTDTNATILTVNPAFTEITGYSAEEAIGQRTSLLRSQHHDANFYRAMWSTIASNGCWQGELWNRRKNGEAFLEWLSISRIDDDQGQPIRYVGVFHDITEMRRHDNQVRHLAFHDALTGLPNRLLLDDRLFHAIERAKRDGERLALAFLDLDRFKAVNDTLGHDVGDLLLQEIARRIKDCLRAADTVARLGGDEFVFLLEEQLASNHLSSLVTELLDTISQPIELRGHMIEVGASLGIAFYPDDGTDSATLMKNADRAMYVAKAKGRTTWCYYGEIDLN